MKFNQYPVVVSLGLILLSGTVHGQTNNSSKNPPPKPAAAPQAPKQADPQPAANAVTREETKKIENWVVRCQYNQTAKVGCSAVMVVRDPKSQQAIIELDIIRTAPTQSTGRISLRSGAFIEPGVTVTTDNGYNSTAKFIVCRPGICVAEFNADDNFKKIAAAAKTMSISYVRGDRQKVNSQFNLTGIDKVLSEIN